MFEFTDVEVLGQHVGIAEAEGAVDEIDQEGGELGERGEGLVAGSAVGVAVGGDDEGAGTSGYSKVSVAK